MNAKEYLLQVKKLDKLIANKIIEKEQWKAIATGTVASSDGERVQASGSQQKMADAVCKYITIENKIDSCIDSLIAAKQDVIRTIEQLPVLEYDLLHKVYIGISVADDKGRKSTKYLTLDDIADINSKTYRWATKIHGRALSKVQKILDTRGQS